LQFNFEAVNFQASASHVFDIRLRGKRGPTEITASAPSTCKSQFERPYDPHEQLD